MHIFRINEDDFSIAHRAPDSFGISTFPIFTISFRGANHSKRNLPIRGWLICGIVLIIGMSATTHGHSSEVSSTCPMFSRDFFVLPTICLALPTIFDVSCIFMDLRNHTCALSSLIQVFAFN